MKNIYRFVLNPPYSPIGNMNLYLRILLRIADDHLRQKNSELEGIIPANWMAGINYSKFRETFSLLCGFKTIHIKPIGTFKKHDGSDVLTTTCIIRAIKGYNGPTEVIWDLDGKTFTTTQQVNGTRNDIYRYLGIEGQALFTICNQWPQRMKWNAIDTDGSRILATGPNAHFSEKLDTGYFGQIGRNSLCQLNGSKVLRGVVCDFDNTKPYIPKKKGQNSKRLVVEFDTPLEVENFGWWVKTRLFGLLLVQTSTQHSISSTTLGKLPMIILPGKYYSVDEYEKAVYTSLKEYGLTSKLVDWTQTVGGRVQTVCME